MSATMTVPDESTERKEATRAIQTELPASELALQERIRMRAYELYEQRNGAPGDPDDDWFRAEAEIIGGSDQTDH